MRMSNDGYIAISVLYRRIYGKEGGKSAWARLMQDYAIATINKAKTGKRDHFRVTPGEADRVITEIKRREPELKLEFTPLPPPPRTIAPLVESPAAPVPQPDINSGARRMAIVVVENPDARMLQAMQHVVSLFRDGAVVE